VCRENHVAGVNGARVVSIRPLREAQRYSSRGWVAVVAPMISSCMLEIFGCVRQPAVIWSMNALHTRGRSFCDAINTWNSIEACISISLRVFAFSILFNDRKFKIAALFLQLVVTSSLSPMSSPPRERFCHALSEQTFLIQCAGTTSGAME
jgi:hypothetical protein